MEFVEVGCIKSEPCDEIVETQEFEDGSSFPSECLDIKAEVVDDTFNTLVTFYESPCYENDLHVKDEILSENGEGEIKQQVENSWEEPDSCDLHGEFVLEQDEDSAKLDTSEESIDPLSQESEHSDWSQQEELNADWPSERKRRKLSKNTSSRRKQTLLPAADDDFATHFLAEAVFKESSSDSEYSQESNTSDSESSQEWSTRYNLRGKKRKKTPVQKSQPQILSRREKNKLELATIEKQNSSNLDSPPVNIKRIFTPIRDKKTNKPKVQSSNTPTFKCDFCGDILIDQLLLIFHINEKHSDKCIVKKDQLQIALRAKMKEVKPTSDTNRKVNTLDALKKQYQKKEIKDSSSKTLTLAKKYKCGICLSLFVTLEQLFQHFNGHSKEDRREAKKNAASKEPVKSINDKMIDLPRPTPPPLPPQPPRLLCKLKPESGGNTGQRLLIRTLSATPLWGQAQVGTDGQLRLTREIPQGQMAAKQPATVMLLTPPNQVISSPVALLTSKPVAPPPSNETIIGTPLDEPIPGSENNPKSSELIIGTPLDSLETEKEITDKSIVQDVSPVEEPSIEPIKPILSHTDPLINPPISTAPIKPIKLVFSSVNSLKNNSPKELVKLLLSHMEPLQTPRILFTTKEPIKLALSHTDPLKNLPIPTAERKGNKTLLISDHSTITECSSQKLSIKCTQNEFFNDAKQEGDRGLLENCKSYFNSKALVPPSNLSSAATSSTPQVTIDNPVKTVVPAVTSETNSIPLAPLIPPTLNKVIPDFVNTPIPATSSTDVAIDNPVRSEVPEAVTFKVTSIPLARLQPPVPNQVIPDIPSMAVASANENTPPETSETSEVKSTE